MCGIVGVLRFGSLGNKNHRESAIFFGVTLLELTEARGKDATGVVSLFDDGSLMGQKMGTNATEFISRFGGKEHDFDSYTTVIREHDPGLRVMIGHCRKKSVGDSYDNVNNHPIKTGDIVGVHNGTLTNHDVIFKNLKCKRDGDVDSEAIFRLFEYFTGGCQNPFTLDIVEEVIDRLHGSFSILAINANNPNQVVSARDARPAEYCFIRPLGIVLVASEKKFIEAAIWKYNQMARLFDINKFTKLKSADVEFSSLADDTAALFDLTIEVTETTKLADLYTTRKCNPTAKRIWKAEIKSAYQNIYQDRSVLYPETLATKASQTVVDDKKSTEVVANNNNAAKLWNHKLGRFVTVENEDAEATTVVDIERDTKVKPEVAAIENAKDNAVDEKTTVVENKPAYLSSILTESNHNVERYLSMEKAAIATVSITSTTALLGDIKKMASTGKEKSKDEIEAQKMAIEAGKELIKFETIEDIASVCDIDPVSIEKVTVVALANRIMKYAFPSIFKKGWLKKCEMIEAAKTTVLGGEGTTEQKVTSAQRHVRILKGIAGMLSTAAECGKDNVIPHIKQWASSLPEGSEITSTAVKSIFNNGDFRTYQLLKIAAVALEKNDK